MSTFLVKRDRKIDKCLLGLPSPNKYFIIIIIIIIIIWTCDSISIPVTAASGVSSIELSL